MIRRKLVLWGGGACLLLLFSMVISLSLGSAGVPLQEVWGILFHRLTGWGDGTGWTAAHEQIVFNVRFPRVVLGILVGATLGVAGSGFQGVLRNPLADPYTLGIASGCSVGAAFIILFGWQQALGRWTIPLVAFLTGIFTLVVVLRLAYREGKARTETLILAGVVMQAFMAAFVTLLVSLAGQYATEIVFWVMGSLSLRGWEYSALLLPYFLIGFIIMLRFVREMNLFALGERQAAHLGVNLERMRVVVLMVSTLMTAAAVSVCGVIAFVGLVVPHLIRLALGPDYRLIVPISAAVGGLYVLWADTLARVALSPREIPLGVVTALLGTPFFAYLLRRHKLGKAGETG